MIRDNFMVNVLNSCGLSNLLRWRYRAIQYLSGVFRGVLTKMILLKYIFDFFKS